MTNDPGADRIEKLLVALLSVVVADRDDRLGEGSPRRNELVLADAGLSIAEIASVTGKTYDAVKSTLRRSRPSAAETPPKKSAAAQSSGESD